MKTWPLVDIISHPFRWLHYRFGDPDKPSKFDLLDRLAKDEQGKWPRRNCLADYEIDVAVECAHRNRLIQKFGAASRRANDPETICPYRGREAEHWLRAYHNGEAQAYNDLLDEVRRDMIRDHHEFCDLMDSGRRPVDVHVMNREWKLEKQRMGTA